MKLLYTDMRHSMTSILAKEAAYYAKEGKRVFYIAPNSLSFEKERAVLENLPEQASFAITITRFAQLGRYFVLPKADKKESLDDTGLSILFYRVLSEFSEQDLKVFGSLRSDSHFIEQLVALYHELKGSNLSVLDLEHLSSPEKREDLIKIFLALETKLQEGHFSSQGKLAHFSNCVTSGLLDQALKEVVVIIDGFTRFSAEEELLIAYLNQRCLEIVIGTYASQKAYQMPFVEGNFYQAGVDFLRQLALSYQTKPVYVEEIRELTTFSKVSQLLEAKQTFTEVNEVITDDDKSHLELWDVINQKEEVEQVAKTIRYHLNQGYRYKDISVLLGDVESYKLQIGKIFDKYDIPYYFGKAESMATHPLVHFMESLDRLKRYNFRAEDLMNLLKSGLYGKFSQYDIDYFERYITFADIKGQAKFAREFKVNHAQQYNLEAINEMRQEVMTPLLDLFKTQSRTISGLLKKWQTFLSAISLTDNLTTLAYDDAAIDQEKHEEVWKVFTHILEQMATIFADSALSLGDFLGLLRSGMLVADYRVVPATVDVVNVKSYDLIEPHSNKIIFAIGLTQTNFPKFSKNTSLISDEERQAINEQSHATAHLDIVSKDHLKKNHFAALSLFNAASDHLILSRPQLLNETSDEVSPYLLQLEELGFSVQTIGRHHFELAPENIGHYKGLLSTLVDLQRDELAKEWNENLDQKETKTYWSVVLRYLRKQLEKEGVSIPTITDQLVSTPLTKDTLAILYPKNQVLQVSASSIRDFYQNEYSYFLKHVLRLKEQDSIHPDARSHGNFLHRIFEKVTQDTGPQSFDEKLEIAIQETRQEATFKALYEENQESQYAQSLLLDVARRTAKILEAETPIEIKAEEAVFGDERASLRLSDERHLIVRGKIDRIDVLEGTDYFGVVDYKSSENRFDIKKFYHGLSPQLLTYISAIKESKHYDFAQKVFGAMYLHMLDPIVNLNELKNLDEVLSKLQEKLKYQGIFLDDISNHLGQEYYKTSASKFSQEELEVMLAYNDYLFKKAGQKILSGQFDINPISEDGKSIATEQYKSITRFEANLHLSNARFLEKLQKGEKRDLWIEKMKGDLD